MASTPSDFGIQSPTYKEMSASGLVKTGSGRLFGIFCNTTTAGTLIIYDGITAGGTAMFSGLALTAGTLYNLGNVLFGTGLYIALTNVADWTVIYY
jgi:hypothetical protein